MPPKSVRKNRHVKAIEKIIGSSLVYLPKSRETQGACWISKDYSLVVQEIDDNIIDSMLNNPKIPSSGRQAILENYTMAKNQGAEYIISFNMDGGVVQSYLESVRRFVIEKIPFILHKGHFIADNGMRFVDDEVTGIFLFKEEEIFRDFLYLKKKFEGFIKRKLSFTGTMEYIIFTLKRTLREEERKKRNKKGKASIKPKEKKTKCSSRTTKTI